jgi:integrase
MGSNRNWKAQLSAIIREYNDGHAVRDKEVSHNTRQARRQGLFRMFMILRRMGFHLEPRNLGAKHVCALMTYWTAGAPAHGELVRGMSSASWPTAPYSAAYIQQQLSILRVFAGWLGKPRLVGSALDYVEDAGLVRRSYCAKVDRGWAANGVDMALMTERVRAIDRHVAAQLQLMMAFGLRRKEAVMFCPRDAEVPAHAMPANHPPGERYISFLRIKRGTKGGRLRFTAVRTEEQRAALAEAERLARGKGNHIGRPGLTLKQSLDLFSNVVRQVGLTRKDLGVTPHGLRHQFANDLYFDISGLKSPVQGGDAVIGRAAMMHAYREVARQLGHNRPQISNAYLGAPRVMRRKVTTVTGSKG